MSHELSVLVAQYGLPALFAITFIKAMGVPVPVPADIIVLLAATGSAGGKFVLWETVAALLTAMVSGGAIQFALARGPGRSLLYRFGRYVLLTPARLDLAFQRVENVGVLGISLAVTTPGIRTAAIPACGLTSMRMRTFLAGLTLGTAAYLTVQFFVAYAGVKLLLRVWNDDRHLWLVVTLMCLLIAASVAVVIRHRVRHLFVESATVEVAPRASLRLAQGGAALRLVERRSLRCPVCWMLGAGDRLSRHRAGPHDTPDPSRSEDPAGARPNRARARRLHPQGPGSAGPTSGARDPGTADLSQGEVSASG